VAYVYEDENGEIIGYELENVEELKELIILMLQSA